MLELEMVTPEYRHYCEQPGCRNPYFLTTDLKRRYCSLECRAAARRRTKMKWARKSRRAAKPPAARAKAGRSK